MRPSKFKKFPYSSVLQNCECEIIAANIMTILSRTKDEFRKLTWQEYKKERLKDGEFTMSEKEYFSKVIKYFKSSDTAKLFSEAWNS